MPGGASPNPGGRPKETLYTALQRQLREMVEVVDPVTGEKSSETKYDVVARAVIGEMLKGDTPSVALIMDREDPKVVRNLNHEVTAFDASMDKLIDGLMETPEGEAKLAAMMRGDAPETSTDAVSERAQRAGWKPAPYHGTDTPSTPEDEPVPPEGPPNEVGRLRPPHDDLPPEDQPNEVEHE